MRTGAKIATERTFNEYRVDKDVPSQVGEEARNKSPREVSYNWLRAEKTIL